MTKAARWLALVLLTVPLVGCIGSTDQAVDPTASETGQVEPANLTAFTKVHTPEEATELVERYDQLAAVEAETIGASFEGRPIHMVTVGEGPFELWVVGRQHGDEPTGGEAILLAIETLADPDATLPTEAPPVVHEMREHREELLERVTFHFVPIANPDGAAAYQRTTALEVDPNRDHYLFTQPSTQALREAFWSVRPDGCIDLHNEGLGETGFDAFGPEGPFMEDEPRARMLEDASLGVREVDAAGGNAGSFNENYRAPAPADDHPNPTAVHPGTHDMFCTTRGAPGWTPEGAIPAGENGIDDPAFAWSTRTHWVTIAASAFHWAGAYDASQPSVWKAQGDLGPDVEETVEIRDPANVTFQVVWRETETGGDHQPVPTQFTVTTPEGETLDGRMPTPESWTSTVQIEDANAGTYQLALTGAPMGTYEMRAYATEPGTPLVEVQRDDAGLTVEASADAPGPVEVTLTDVADPIEANATGADASFDLVGTADERTLVLYELSLEPGASTTIETPEGWTEAGPYRFTATSGEILHTAVEAAYNPAPDDRSG